MIKKEYFFAALIAFIVLVFSNIYLLYGVFEPKDNLVFLERRVINSQDTYTYVSFIEQARQGRVLFTNLYSTEPQTATLIRPSYALLGVFASTFHTQSITAYHIGRILFSVFFFIILYAFLFQFFKTPKRRLLAFTVVLTASGWGFFLQNFFSQSSDLWIPESNMFLSLQEAPHFALAQALMVLSFLFILQGFKKEKAYYFVFSFLALFVLGFEHPYNLLICVGTVTLTGVYLWIAKKAPRKLVYYAVGSTVLSFISGFGYQYLETLRNPTLKSWVAESSSPTPLHYMLGFGFLLVFALIGTEKFLKERKVSYVFVLSWIAAGSILMYAPVFFQRRLSEGFSIPLSILAAEGIISICIFVSSFGLVKVRSIVIYAVSGFLVTIMLLGTLVGVYTDVKTISGDNVDNYYYYLLQSEVDGMNYLRDNSNPNDTILTNWFYGNILPGVAGRKVYIGHKAQTKAFEQKVSLINHFILNKNTQESLKFLKDNSIDYIYVGKNDSMSRYGFKPDEKPYLSKIFDQNEVRIYKVK